MADAGEILKAQMPELLRGFTLKSMATRYLFFGPDTYGPF